ncbi:MAG TPA: dTDP-4-dehydrorhamnose 3,5-epimerase [Steroidobacteraceae bacterium]|nr:dTDP-4-dehydrorhamnose 3,5-epimerase [Steroidobacteraceae bacterium]
MVFQPTALAEVILIRPRVFTDPRGFFFESWRQDKFTTAGITASFVQDNHSHSVRHTLRGLHFQIQQPQGKLVRVTRGEAFDVAVDIRRSSATFGQWVGVTLSETNRHLLWVPPGFAHGYLALSEAVDFLYKCTDFYAPQHERAIRWDDPTIGVRWPLPAGVAPLLSAPDAAAPLLQNAECFP